MARIDLRAVDVEFPVYNINSRSLKKHFIRLATGGRVVRDANKHVVVRALSDINIAFEHGDRVGLVGHNGSGKSTFLRLLATIYEPTNGDILIEGNISPILELTQGIEAELTGYENILVRGTLLGLTHKQITERSEEIAELTGLGDYMSMPIRTYSAGMMVRLAFAISSSIQPEILLIDEIFAAGDANFMQKAQAKMTNLLNESSIVVMATHSNELIKEFCNKVLVLEGGKIKFFGDPNEGLEVYKQHSN